jgi:hypothetical protein
VFSSQFRIIQSNNKLLQATESLYLFLNVCSSISAYFLVFLEKHSGGGGGGDLKTKAQPGRLPASVSLSGDPSSPLSWPRRKIRMIECNAKCRYLKKFTLRRCFYLSEATSPPMTPYAPAPLTHCTVYLYAAYLFTQGRGGWGES